MKDYSLMVLKPDAIERNLEKPIIELIRKNNLQATRRKEMLLSEAQIAVLYLESQMQSYYPRILDYLTRGKVVCYVVLGENALDRLNLLVGKTDPKLANEGTLRNIFGLNILENTLHSSNENRVDDEIVSIYGSHLSDIK